MGESAIMCIKNLSDKPHSKFQNKLQLPSLNIGKINILSSGDLTFGIKICILKHSFDLVISMDNGCPFM